MYAYYTIRSRVCLCLVQGIGGGAGGTGLRVYRGRTSYENFFFIAVVFFRFPNLYYVVVGIFVRFVGRQSVYDF